ncbi:hypothetical protein GUJ93_ZPchr0001g29955 [Zizania palustris]|uniref:RING-CH-type domain-containing protein n=1 Tax=Zizania palustris TaxID=103762 RepID=A0A8J5VP83_ZIZPA|nr:hypothetical protein GUJ93_ZPchr0001g29955 [Zizania palustris]
MTGRTSIYSFLIGGEMHESDGECDESYPGKGESSAEWPATARVVCLVGAMVNNGEQVVIVAATECGVEPVRHGDGGGDGGERGPAEESSDDEKGNQRFSDAEDQSWRSHSRQDSAALEDFISTCASGRSGAGASAGDADGESAARLGRGRKSCVSECSQDDVDLEAGQAEITKASPDTVEKNCRICHLGLESAAAESGSGMFLGCSCKNDLSCAHKQCAETWFKIRGNRYW